MDMLTMFKAANALCLSHLPEKTFKFWPNSTLAWERVKALEFMYMLGDNGTSFLSPAAKIILCFYECVIVPVVGARQADTDRILNMINNELDQCEQVGEHM